MDISIPEIKPVMRWVWLSLIALIVLWGAWLRIAAVDTYDFQNDEYYHVDAAKGLLQTGSFVRWDYLAEEPRSSYTRGAVYTAQVSASIALFGEENEWAYRLPSLLWGLVFLVLIPALAYYWSRSYPIALLATSFVAFDRIFIWASTTTRMYSMLAVVVLLTIWAYQQLVDAWAKDAPRKTQLKWGLATAGLFILSALTHQVALVLLAGFTLHTAYLAYANNQRRVQIAILGTIAIGGGAALILHVVVTPFLPFEFITIRNNPAWQYAWYPFSASSMSAGIVLAIAAIVSVVMWKKWEWIRLHWIIAAPTLFYFVFFADRYAARKYSMLIFVCTYLLVGAGIGMLVYRFPKSAALPIIALVLLFVLPLSIPVPNAPAPFEAARSQRGYADLNYHEYTRGYALFNEYWNEAPGAVSILLPRTYYLAATDINDIQRIPTKKQWAIEDVKGLESRDSAWIVWPRYKGDHLKKEVREYIDEYWERKERENTGIAIYQWTAFE